MKPSNAATTLFAAFAAGWSVMSLEILNGRLMAPAFGQTVYQWGALIGTAMTFMAAGYWTGGRLGSGARAGTALPSLLWVAASCASMTPWLGRDVAALAEARMGPLAGAMAASAVLLGIPAFALAAVSPLCVGRLAGEEGAPAASGSVSALGSAGSIGGTFFAAFVAVPYMGLTAGYASAALVAAAAALATGLAPRRVALALLPLVAGATAQHAIASRYSEYFETPYNTVMVAETAEATYLLLNSPRDMQSMMRKDGGPTGYYWDMLAAVPALSAGRSALFLGVAGGTAVTATVAAWPGIDASGVEIDPAVTAVARRRFGLRVPVAEADARRFVDSSTGTWDSVVVDLYATGQMPAHVATVEFYRAVARRLAPGGVVALNVFGAGDPSAIVGPVLATLRSVFPGVLSADAGNGNVILLAWERPMTAARARAMLDAAPPSARKAADLMSASLAEPPPPGPSDDVLTDERSDLEIRAARALAALGR